MANKFLGEAGLDVLASQIKTRVYVGQMVDELKAALEFFKETGLPESFTTKEQLMHYHVLMGAASTDIGTIFNGKDMNSAAGIQAAYDEFIGILEAPTLDGVNFTANELLHTSAVCETILFNPRYNANIEEITAQEVTNKFNS